MTEYKVPNGIKRKVSGSWVPCPAIINRAENLLIGDLQYAKSLFKSHRQQERYDLEIKDVVRLRYDNTLYQKIGETVTKDATTYTIIPVTAPLTDVKGKRSEVTADAQAEALRLVKVALDEQNAYSRLSMNAEAQAWNQYINDLDQSWKQDIIPFIDAAITYEEIVEVDKTWRKSLPPTPQV